MPFVQGHLRNESIEITIDTQCAHCDRPLQVEVDSQLAFRCSAQADPLIFLPIVDFEKLRDPSIIDAF